MKKKKLKKLIDKRISKASKKALKELFKDEHFTEEQTEAVVKTSETEEKVVEYEWRLKYETNNPLLYTQEKSIDDDYPEDITIAKITKYANEETPVIEKL